MYARMRALCVLLIVVASTAVAQRIKVEVDDKVDFFRYKTFSWAGCGIPREDAMLRAEETAQRVMNAAREQLGARGLKEVAEDPDLRFGCYLDLQVGGTNRGVGGVEIGEAWGDIYRKHELVRWVLIAVDGMDGNPVWRAYNAGPLYESKEDEKRIPKIIEKAVEKYPAKFEGS